MKRLLPLLITATVLFLLPAFGKSMIFDLRGQNLDRNWRFLPADAPGAEQPMFDDRAWRTVDVPHDWSIAGPFSETNKTGGAGAFLPCGVGWYRKDFTLPAAFSNRCVSIEFDGVMANSDVWINGFHLGHRPYGYVSFSHELTGHLNFGAGRTNVLAVRADTSDQPASRWYSGAGIYRHIRLMATGPVHFERNAIFVSTPQVSATQAIVQVELSVTNQSGPVRDFIVQTMLVAPNGKVVATNEMAARLSAAIGAPSTVSARTESSEHAEPVLGAPVAQQIILPNPELWDLDSPKLYRAVSKIISAGKTLDEVTNTFGIRDAQFDPATGFWLNGKNFKVKGVCLHQDGGAFGVAVPLGVWEERLNNLKALGVNAIRTAHNPPAPEFLDLCDRLGFLVMDEMFDCWTVAKNPYDYHLYFNEWSKTDERDTILRDRNHPSIILYSVGNEIHDTPKAELAKGILQGLVATAHEADPTRPVTQALFRPNVSGDYTNGLADLLDVVGQNYRENEILAAHEQKPTRKIIGTENTHDRRQWVAMRDHAPYAGQFLWTGIDYLGESRRWPMIGHGSGLLDRTGAARPIAFERQSWWSEAPMVHIARRLAATETMPTDPGYGAEERHTQVLFSDWTPKNPQPHEETVEVYSNGQDVELFLNGKSLGAKPLPADASARVWKVAWASGILTAVARNDGKTVAADELRTAGAPAKIILAASCNQLPFDWNEVAAVRATVVDAHDVAVPGAQDLISFKLSGPGVVAAVDNADNASHEPFQAEERQAFQGRCVAFVKATASSGKIILTASAPGLKSGKVVIKACPPAAAP